MIKHTCPVCGSVEICYLLPPDDILAPLQLKLLNTDRTHNCSKCGSTWNE